MKRLGCTLAALLIGAGLAAALGPVQSDNPFRFSDATAAAGINFKHVNGASPEKYLPETMSGGVLLFDYDNDGWLDIFFVNGGSFADKRIAAGAQHRLYRNNKDGTFADGGGRTSSPRRTARSPPVGEFCGTCGGLDFAADRARTEAHCGNRASLAKCSKPA